ncbi:hypothetical protein F2Q70_00042345 [Brassica cretica]|uniref:Uncharacterized protein n=2 Tax=Brassica cretica TaxID=69181 RepID=A0A8S9PIW3_BRACR|nr:hypothetical protein F2Q70_00042345 [Brassica cretica]KAF3519290.1 hypothetical protein DY000_02058597 [Brassica cretica]KAF3521945.1 hypothetical protein F2Q69_00046037 [Brassica cretica]
MYQFKQTLLDRQPLTSFSLPQHPDGTHPRPRRSSDPNNLSPSTKDYGKASTILPTRMVISIGVGSVGMNGTPESNSS